MHTFRSSLLSLCVAFLLLPLRSQHKPVETSGSKEKVLGIGGMFFRADDPKALSDWYLKYLGIDPAPASYDVRPWMQESGPTVFAPFARKTGYFGDMKNQWMINFRVRDLDAMAEQLRRGGISVEIDPEVYPNGRFARLLDPEGNPIQLWEPSSQ